jgi:hypothetical protein
MTHVNPSILSIIITFSFLNIFACILTLYLVTKNPKKNSYNDVIFFMTIFQLIVNLSSTFDDILIVNDFDYIVNDETYLLIIELLLLPSGLATALLSLIITWILFYIVYFRAYIDVNYFKFRLYGSVSIIISVLAFFVCFTLLKDGYLSDSFLFVYDIYNHSRIIITAIIILMLTVTFYILNKTQVSISEKGKHPIYLLAKKLILYPVIQFVTRFPNFIWRQFYFNDGLPNAMYYINLFCIIFGGLGNFIAYWIANPVICKNIVLDLFLCNKLDSEEIEEQQNDRLSEINDKYDRSSLASIDRDSTVSNGNYLLRSSSVNQFRMTVSDFNIYDEEGNMIIYGYEQCESLDEEQLVRRIAVLNSDLYKESIKNMNEKESNQVKIVEMNVLLNDK